MAVVRKHRSDLVILFSTLGLMALGLIVIYAIGPMRANVLNNTYGTDYDANFFFVGQLRSVGLSLLAFFAAFKWIPYKHIRRFAKPIMIVALALSALLWVLDGSVPSGFSSSQKRRGKHRQMARILATTYHRMWRITFLGGHSPG